MHQSSTLRHDPSRVAGSNGDVNGPSPTTYLRFSGLRVGESFLFVGDNTSARPDTDVIVRRVKGAARNYVTQWDDGSTTVGHVGLRGNPIVRRVTFVARPEAV